MKSGKGTIYLCATPIGNLEDITLRALRVLKEVDYIAAEDTRHTLKLLNHYGISKPLLSYHEHNRKEKGEEIAALVESGYDVALVSDAGMPGISDPGEDLVALAHQRSLPITVIPGPTASLSALVLSGLPSGRFAFEGFLPREKKDRKERLKKLKKEERTMIFYEAPHRLLSTLKDLLAELGNRRIVLVRELTKIHEEVLPFFLEEAVAYYENQEPRGEYVLIVDGYREREQEKSFDDLSIKEHIKNYMEAGLSKKEAIKQVAKDRNMAKSEVYKYSIGI